MIRIVVIINAILKFFISLPITKPITMAATNISWLLVGLNMYSDLSISDVGCEISDV